jgi:hypothetical protein
VNRSGAAAGECDAQLQNSISYAYEEIKKLKYVANMKASDADLIYKTRVQTIRARRFRGTRVMID